jgi:hypothetical protein
MKSTTLIDELMELSDPKEDKKIVNTFKTKDTLCLDIFDKIDEGYLMKKEIRDKLTEIADEFIEYLDLDVFVHDLVLTGSLSNYNWSEYSDVDLHILVDMDELLTSKKIDSTAFKKIIKDFFDGKKQLWNNTHDVTIKGFEVELYVQDIDEPHVSSGVYSVLHNEWVVNPSPDKEDIDEAKILEKGEYFAKQIDSLIEKESKSDDTIKQINDLKDKIKKFRQSGLEKGGEYSYENLTFKLLRRNGYIKKLMDLKNTITDKKLSLR